ncbi:MAG TPA: heavy metal-associated domain-containing protein [Anaerolineaceae bacterium]|nr:heavy metal-associated domain-containing protein [Anaerolineaceae bacterium]
MNPSVLAEQSFPVSGMSCGGCAAHVEQELKKLPGVSRADVNLTAQRASVRYDPNQVDIMDFQQAVVDAGYAIPTAKVRMAVGGMTCISCASHVQGAIGDLPGVLAVTVHLSKGTAEVTFVPELVSPAQIAQAVVDAGYKTDGLEEHDPPARGVDRPREVPAGHRDGFSWRFKHLLRRG